ncbi:MAG: PDZ domain-containing protein [Thermogutta sp.]|nr:PDZ domain-containing protein [Thermogutta sp.]
MSLQLRNRSRLIGRLPVVLVWLCLLFAPSWSGVRAQSAGGRAAVPTALEKYGPVSEETRAELVRELSEKAAVLEAQSAVVRLVAKIVGPAVVHIEAEVPGRRALQSGSARPVEEAGSGILVRLGDRLCILTNRHVVRDAEPDKVRIHLADGRLIQPTEIRSDPATDVAVLIVSAPNLVTAEIGDSDKTDIGDFVLAFGSPFGLSHSVTFGIISAKGRRELDLGDSSVRLQDFLQTDAAINPGNSGGPLVDLRGRVIGINTAIASNSGGNEGIGFAIPINTFLWVARQLVESGTVQRAFLGVSLDARFDAAAAQAAGLDARVGARVVTVTPDSPASAVGIQPGDIILRFDDRVVEDDAHLVYMVNTLEIGKEVELQVFRAGQVFTVKTKLASRPDSAGL